MKNKRLVSVAVAVAFVLVVSCCFSAFALTGLTLGDYISLGVNFNDFTDYSSSEWEALSVEERRTAFNTAITACGGTPHFTDDFLSDAKNSHNHYSSFITGYSVAGGIVPNVAGSISLELNGQADLHLGFYNNDYTDTPAGELNDDFLNYLQENPYESNNIFHRLSSGDYTFEYGADLRDYFNPYNQQDCYLVIGFCNVYYKGVLYDSLDFGGDTIVKSNSGSFETATSKYNFFKDNIYYDYDTMQIVIPKNLQFNSTADYCYIGNYITSEPIEESDDIEAVAIDDDGNQIDININSDGVTYEGNTYNYNNDNTVTIGDKTYYIAVQPNNVDDDYYKQFLNDTINNYYNYYTTNSTPFDGTDILTSLRSIFSSLETFRSYCYSQLKQIYDTVYSGFNNMRSSFKTLGNKLDEIIKQLKNINKQLDNITEEQKEQNNLNWLSLITKFQNKIGYSSLVESMGNISSGFFGTRTFTVNESGGINVSISSDNGSSVPSSMPSLSVEYLGNKYDLYTCLGSLEGISTIKSFISLFLWAGFLISLFRSIPSIIGGVASVQDHSNNVVIDKNTGEVKWGA